MADVYVDDVEPLHSTHMLSYNGKNTLNIF